MSTEPTDPQVTQQLAVVTSAIEVSLGVKELTVAFSKRRDELTAAAFEFKAPPTTDEEQEEILTAQRAVAKLRTELTKNSDALKAPLNSARSKIIDLTNTAEETLKKAEKHCQGLINAYQTKLTDARNAEAARLEADRKRIADQAAAAEREQAEAERKRQAAALATSTAEKKILEAEAAALDADAYGKLLEAESAPMPAVPSAPAPQAREVRDFTLNGRHSDEHKDNLRRLLAAHPEFFSVEVKQETPRSYCIRLRVSDLVDALNGKEPFAKLDHAPGITVSTKLTTLR